MTAVCRWSVRIFGLLYLLALMILVIGIIGLFGQERDPLAGLFLVPLGLPWTFLTGEFPEQIRPWLAILSPALNFFIIAGMCRLAGRGNMR